MAHRIWEACKSILIVILIVNILLLSLLALPGSLLKGLPLPAFLRELAGISQTQLVLPTTSQYAAEVTRPLLISIVGQTGRATVRQDVSAISMAYDKFSRFYSLALATAKEEQHVSGWEFLSRPGVLLSYGGNIPAQALSQWLGKTDGKLTGVFSHYALICEGEQVYLYTVQGDTILRYTTSVHQRELLAQMAEYPADGTHLAYDLQEQRAHPLTLMEEALTLPEYTAVSPVTQSLSDELAVLLNFNAYGTGAYTDPNGNRVYTEGQRTLVVSSGGITWNLPAGESGRFSVKEAKASDFVAAARQALSEIGLAAGVNAEMYLCDFRQENGVTVCTFSYMLGSIPVSPACATVTFTENHLTSLSCTLRVFHRTGAYPSLIPLSSAVAIAEKHKILTPAYHMSASGIAAGWLQK